jgi:hypothetical protein
MKNILNIFIFYFLVSFLNVWSYGNTAPNDILWAVATEIVETEEKENEEYAKNNTSDYEKVKQRGQGGGDKLEDIVISTQQLTNFLLFTSRVSPQYSERHSLKQYHSALLNSLTFPKLYILFHCSKTFLS